AGIVGDQDFNLVRALLWQEEIRRDDGVLGCVGVLEDQGRRNRKDQRVCRVKYVDRRGIVGNRIGAAGVDGGGDWGRGNGGALSADDREGRDGQRALGYGGGGRSSWRRGGRVERERDRYKVYRHRDRAPREGDRVVDRIDTCVDEGVRASDVVEARVDR